MAENSFDRIAWAYDSLAHLVFFGAIKRAQLSLLHKIPKNANLLIIGGGSGWILTELDRLGISISVDYIEASGQMLKKTQQHQPFNHIKVSFIHGTQESIPVNAFYDVVITNFFLDVFSPANLPGVMAHLDRYLNPVGKWIMTDFVDNGKWWQRLLVKIMYVFFRATTDLEGAQLLNFDTYFHHLGYNKSEQKSFFGRMIISRIYSK